MTINCLGNLIDLTTPKVMGILNLTPNSFYDGGQYTTEKAILQQIEKMRNQGADFIDMGAYSSKPNADFVGAKEEADRLLPVLKSVLQHFPDTLISVDTFRSEIAQAALDAGAAIINDISAGLLDSKMLETVAQYQVPYVMMHMKGSPQNMASLSQYENIVKEILVYFSERIGLAKGLGINDIIVDPGFGFAKTLEQNYQVLQRFELFQMLEMPLLVGLSRKSMVYKTLGTSAAEALNGTTVLNTIALTKGANILRVHDVKEALEAIKLIDHLN